MNELAASREVLNVLIEAMRRKFCGLKRYSFYHSQSGGVNRVEEKGGAWVRWDEVHALFDVVAWDALLGPGRPSGGERFQKVMLNAEGSLDGAGAKDKVGHTNNLTIKDAQARFGVGDSEDAHLPLPSLPVPVTFAACQRFAEQLSSPFPCLGAEADISEVKVNAGLAASGDPLGNHDARTFEADYSEWPTWPLERLRRERDREADLAWLAKKEGKPAVALKHKANARKIMNEITSRVA